MALTAAAAVTERVRLMTNVALVPTWDPARFAKLTASLDQISGGRLVLGIGVGSRPDDFEATGRDMSTRGRAFDDALEVLHATWSGKATDGFSVPFGPQAVNGRVQVSFAGDPERAARRAARWDGAYTIGGTPFEMAGDAVAAARSVFADNGGAGRLRITCLNYFSLGDEHTEESLEDLRGYYAFTGDFAEMIAQGAARTPEEIRRRVDGFAGIDVDELVWTPSVAALDQVDRLADALGSALGS